MKNRFKILETVVNKKIIKVGDYVGFKSDVEQYGLITEIKKSKNVYCSYDVVLTNKNGFSGEYINGETKTTISINNVWKDEWYY